MASLLVGDDIISEDDPARILVVGRPEGVQRVRDALREHGAFLKIDACHDLRSALDRARMGMCEVAVLALDLPDSWAVDTYTAFRQENEDVPVLVLAGSEDASLAARRVLDPPFCTIEKDRADPALIRRMVVSATLFRRAGGRPQRGTRPLAAST